MFMQLTTQIFTIQRAVAYGLGYMCWLDTLLALDVGNGAGQLDDSVVGTSREVEARHSHIQQRPAILIQRSKASQHSAIHHSIAVDVQPLEALLLYVACLDYTLAYLATRLTTLRR